MGSRATECKNRGDDLVKIYKKYRRTKNLTLLLYHFYLSV